MSDTRAVEVEVRLVSMNVHHKRSRFLGSPQSSEPEIDTTHVVFAFNSPGEMSVNEQCAGLLLKTEEAKKLNLMVGDLVTIRLTKTKH